MNAVNFIKNIGVKLQNVNYTHELISLKKNKSGLEFKSYNLASAGEQVLFTELKSNSEEGDVVYDLGSHRGHWAIPLATIGRRVIAFEPNPIAYSQLQANTRANDTNVEILNVGTSDTTRQMTFYHSSRQTESSFYKSNAERRGEIVRTTEIEVGALDSLYTKYDLPQPDHIKIDVEEIGPEVIRGGMELIDRYSPTLYIELHPDSDGALQEDETESLLRDLGYKISILTEGTLGYDGGHPWICERRE